MVRVRDGKIETSWGVNDIDVTLGLTMARVYLRGGADAAALVGRTIGPFTVGSVDADWLRVGCHRFHRSELERFCKDNALHTYKGTNI
jgi:hypothetical protein